MEPRFMTGVFGEFERAKVERERRPGFHGLEVSCLRAYDEAENVFRYAKDCRLSVGVHFPLVRGAHPGVSLHARLTSKEAQVRRAGFEKLSWLASGSSVKIVVEHDILHSMHYSPLSEGGLLVRLFKQNPELGFCADLGRLHLSEYTDDRFDAHKFLSLMLPFVTNVHAWTIKVGTNKFGGHHPVHPDLHKEDGWGDIAGLLRILSSLENAYVMFERAARMMPSDSAGDVEVPTSVRTLYPG